MEDLNDILKLSGMKAKVNELNEGAMKEVVTDVEDAMAPTKIRYKLKQKGGKFIVSVDSNDEEDAQKALKMHPLYIAGKLRVVPEKVDEAYTNEPDEKYAPVDAILDQGTDLNRKKQQNAVGGFTGDNPMTEEVNEDEVHELKLYIDNDADLYRQQGEPIMRNLSRKWDKGIYDHELAQKLWYYLAVNGAKKYGQEHSTGNGLKMFSPDVRRAVAKELADDWMAELKAGNKMDEAEEDLEAMLADILISEESPEDRVAKTMPSYKIAQTLGKGVQAGKKMFDKAVQTLTPSPAKKPTNMPVVMPEGKEE